MTNTATCTKCGTKRKFDGATLGDTRQAMMEAGWRYTGEMLKVICSTCGGDAHANRDH